MQHRPVMYNESVLAQLRRPVIFAHRGASAHAPENTMAAFSLAVGQGADAIELDAKLSADGAVVVFHDPKLERTTDGIGRLSACTLSHLRTLDAGSSFSQRYRGERIPLLEEVLDAFGKKVFIVIDLTNYTTPWDGLASRTCELINRHSLGDCVMLSSFLPANLHEAARRIPRIGLGLVAGRGWKGIWARWFGFSFGNYVALHPNFRDVNLQQVKRVHRLKKRVHVWTVNAVDDLRRLAGWGVDGIFTDDPRLALATIGRPT